MKRIFIFGAGEGGKRAFKILARNHEVLGFVDNDKRKHGTRLLGRPIVSPQEAIAQPHDSIVIASMYADEIFVQLMQLGVPSERVDVFDQELLHDRARFPRGIRNLLVFAGILIVAVIAAAVWL
jgi:FlaA1/EpsC-like NDP-sugar epimerase